MNRTILIALACVTTVGSAYAQTITDFESYTPPTWDGAVMFRQPTFSGSTNANILTDPNICHVDKPAGGIAGNTTNVLLTKFKFVSSAASKWLRLSTYNTPDLPNPAVDFSKYLLFDIYTDVDVHIAIGLRETNTTAAIGGNGGAAGGIEMIANNPLGSNSGPDGGDLITAGAWHTYAINIGAVGKAGGPYIKGFAGATADGVLTSTTGKGALEHIAIQAAGGDGPYTIYMDNFRQADCVPEPATLAALGLGLTALIARRRR